MSASGRLPRAPLIHVLGQVKFSTVKKMGAYVSDIQDELRKNGFPLFEESRGLRIRLDNNRPMEEDERWVFSDKDKQSAVILSTDFVVLETNHYTVFDEFLTQFKYVIEVVGRIAEIAYSERIGLRYVDLIRTIGDLTPAQMVVPVLRGLDLSQQTSGASSYQHITEAETTRGTLRINVAHVPNGMLMPPDLDASRLVGDPEVNPDEPTITLDVDHFVKSQMPYSVEDLEETLQYLHDKGTSPAFRAATTQDARAAWGRGD